MQNQFFFLENFEVKEGDQSRSPKINVVHIRVSPSDAKSSKNKKRMVEDDEIGNVIFQSFDNVSMSIDRATEVMAKCFSKSYEAKFHIALGLIDWGYGKVLLEVSILAKMSKIPLVNPRFDRRTNEVKTLTIFFHSFTSNSSFSEIFNNFDQV